MATEQLSELIKLRDWIIRNRDVYHLFAIKIVDSEKIPHNEEKYFSILTIQSNLNRLSESKKKAIESYLYLTDQNAGGDTNVILHYILEVNSQIKQLLGI